MHLEAGEARPFHLLSHHPATFQSTEGSGFLFYSKRTLVYRLTTKLSGIRVDRSLCFSPVSNPISHPSSPRPLSHQPQKTLAARSGPSPNFPKCSRLGNTLRARLISSTHPLHLHIPRPTLLYRTHDISSSDRDHTPEEKRPRKPPPHPLQRRRRQPVKHALGGALKAWFSKHLM